MIWDDHYSRQWLSKTIHANKFILLALTLLPAALVPHDDGRSRGATRHRHLCVVGVEGCCGCTARYGLTAAADETR